MNATQQKINELVLEIQRLVQEEIDGTEIKYDKFVLVDFSDKLGLLVDELHFGLT